MGKAKQRYIQALRKFQRTPETQRGTLGNTLGQVSVPNKPDMAYVTVAGLGVREVKNIKVANVPGTPVKIGYDPLEPNIFQVLGTVSYPQIYNAPQYTNAVGTHAQTHNWSGSDTVWVEKRQLMPLRITPVGAMNLYLGRDIVWQENQWIYHGGITFNMGAAIPATGSRYALIYAGATGSYGILTGTVRDLQTMVFSDLPDPLSGTIPTAIVRLYAGQTGISEGLNDTDIVDVRGLFTPVGGSSGITGALASEITTNTTNFNGNLSAADNTVQKALDTLDNMTAGVGMTNPMTTLNDIIYGGVSGAATRLGIGSNNQVLTLVSGTINWETPTGGSVIFHGCNIYLSADQLISGAMEDSVVFNAEVFDTDNYFGGSGTFVTIPASLGGKYLVIGNLGTQGASSSTVTEMHIKDGTSVVRVRASSYSPSFWAGYISASKILNLSEGDILTMFVYNHASASRNIYGNSNQDTSLTLQYLGA